MDVSFSFSWLPKKKNEYEANMKQICRVLIKTQLKAPYNNLKLSQRAQICSRL
jgi:hypothetical protein